MLIKCPDCKSKISSDVKNCPRCGCIIDAENRVYERVEIKDWSIMGIISAFMTIANFFITPFLLMIVSSLIFKMGEEGFVAIRIFLAFFIPLGLSPIIQVILGTIPLIKRKDIYKWPSIVGIVVGSLGIIMAIMLGGIVTYDILM